MNRPRNADAVNAATRTALPNSPATSDAKTCRLPSPGTNYFCPVCRYEFLPEEIGKKPHCRRCGYLESCCNPDAGDW